MPRQARTARPRAPRLPEQSEASFQAQVMEAAHLLGWLVAHFPDSRRQQGDAGLPDLILARKGRVIFAELKTNKGRIRPEQSAWLDALYGPQVESFVWRPRNWDAICAALR